MSLKSRGIAAERELIHLFNNAPSWSAVRIAGSGSQRYPAPDILAGNALRKLAIECKLTTETKKYLTNEDVEQLRVFARTFGTEAWLGVRFYGEPWYFLSLEDLETAGKSYAVTIESAKRKGLLFEELIEQTSPATTHDATNDQKDAEENINKSTPESEEL